jgi:hypothetical protein
MDGMAGTAPQSQVVRLPAALQKRMIACHSVSSFLGFHPTIFPPGKSAAHQ